MELGSSSASYFGDEPLEALQVVSRREPVDVGQGGRHAAGGRLEARVAEERVQPDHTAGARVDAGEGARQLGGVAALEPVAEDEDDGARVDEGVEVVVDETGQAGADARAAGGV